MFRSAWCSSPEEGKCKFASIPKKFECLLLLLLVFKFSLLLLVFYRLSPVSLLLLPCLLNENCNLLLLQFRVRCTIICQLFFAAAAVAAVAVAGLTVAPYLRRRTSRGWRRSPARSTSPPCRTGKKEIEIEITVHVSFILPEEHFAQ